MQVFLVESVENKYGLEEVRNISDCWPGRQWPPPNEPICGYNSHNAVCQEGSG